MTQEFKELKLSDLSPNPHNYRSDFSGPKFDALVESIVQKGVIQPILARPVKGKKKYEIVFGERRFRAAKVAAARKGGRKTIPALVRELSDSEAYDLMVVENLQREDLTEFEEAHGFKLYLDKNGDESLVDLSQRTDINPAYIRRRVSVLKLPAPVLAAWKEGQIRYGYLEQLSRLDDESEIMAFFEDIMQGSYEINSVGDLKRIIDEQAVSFKHALFDLKQQGCLACHQNSDVQLRLFEIDAEKTKCLKGGCFMEKQEAWLLENWKATKFYKDHKTNGFRFQDRVDRHRCEFFRQKKVAAECRTCDAFVTLFSGIQLNVFHGRVCIGESACFKKVSAAMNKTATKSTDARSGDGGQGQDEQPRVAWHGEYFREAFFRQAIPRRFESLAAGELQAAQLCLFTLVKSGWELKRWFMEKYAGEKECYSPSQEDLFKPIAAMNPDQVDEALKAATLQAVLFDDYSADARRIVADHIGIDLSREWSINEEYLSKKRIREILGMGERLGIFSDPKARHYLESELNKKDFTSCKKKELVQVFLESGVELAGKVPEEILN